MTVLCLHCIYNLILCARNGRDNPHILWQILANSPVNFHLKLSNTNQLQVSVVSACIKTIFLTTYGDIMVVESLFRTTQQKKKMSIESEKWAGAKNLWVHETNKRKNNNSHEARWLCNPPQRYAIGSKMTNTFL